MVVKLVIVTGMALMRMAERDGDAKASQYLATKDYRPESIPSRSIRVDMTLIGLNQNKP